MKKLVASANSRRIVFKSAKGKPTRLYTQDAKARKSGDSVQATGHASGGNGTEGGKC